jgi:hypothetical protein
MTTATEELARRGAVSVSLYEHDCAQLAGFMRAAKQKAKDRGERWRGISFDVDDDGFMFVYAAGMDPIRL